MNFRPDTVAAVAQVCADSDPGLGADALLPGLDRVWPGLTFQNVLTRGGWYRSGGIVDIDKQPVAGSLRAWVEQQAGDDLRLLLDRCLQRPLFATRLVGRSHYLTAKTGPAAADFIQLEVEELQETLERCLSDPDWMPDSLEEFIDPLEYPLLEPEPLGPPRLVFRRLIAAPELLCPGEASTGTAGLTRFLRDWDRSSAGQQHAFCDHWVLGIREALDSDSEPQATAHPVPADRLEHALWNAGLQGAELANWIHSLDRVAGYPMAWFFHLVASSGVPHTVALRVGDDLEQGFSYLPERDLDVLRDYLQDPYRA